MFRMRLYYGVHGRHSIWSRSKASLKTIILDVFELLALKGTIRILKQLSREPRIAYSDLVRTVGHSTTTTRALNAMVKLDLLQKEVLNEKYRPVVYFLTDKGKKLAEIVTTLESL